MVAKSLLAVFKVRKTYFSIFCHKDIIVVSFILLLEDDQDLRVGFFVKCVAFAPSEFRLEYLHVFTCR